MSLANHLEELQRKHGDIERELDEAMLHPSVDDLEIAALKRRKLAIKDEMEKRGMSGVPAFDQAYKARFDALQPKQG